MQTIADSGEIDRLSTIEQLKKLIATIRSNQRATWFATHGKWEISKIFFRKLSIILLEEVPVVKHAVKASRETMEEIEGEMKKLDEEVKDDLKIQCETDENLLTYHPVDLPALEIYEDEEPDSENSSDHNVIDAEFTKPDNEANEEE